VITMAKKEEAKSPAFDFEKSLEAISDWDWKIEAFKRYIVGLGIEIKSDKDLEKEYKKFWEMK